MLLALTIACVVTILYHKRKLFESVFINIEFCNKTLLVGCLYRSPSSDVQSNEIFVSTLVVVVWRGISSKTDERTKAEGLSFYHPGHQTAWVRC